MKSKLELKGVSNDSTCLYIWPECGDVKYFLSEFSPKGADCRLLSTKRCESRHSKDENGMICDFCLVFLRSVRIFCLLIKIKNNKLKKNVHW